MVGVVPKFSISVSRFKYPNGTVALRDVNFQVPEGGSVGILGANGSGKTTLLKVMDGLLKDYDGMVLLEGRNIREMSPREIYKKVGLVFQDPDDQLFATTVWEDVSFGPINMGFHMDEVKERVRYALSAVGLEGFEQMRINDLSYGQKKRVCMAGLLAMGHEALLMDEPLAGLDPVGELKMVEVLRSLNQSKGVTLVIASHNVDLIPLFLNQIHILKEGTLVVSGTPKEIFKDPQELLSYGLRFPYVTELGWRLKYEDGLPLNGLPITVKEARESILHLIKDMRCEKKA